MWGTRDEVINYLENYTSEVKDQIDAGKTKQTLLKSYIFETFNSESETKRLQSEKIHINELIVGKEHELIQVDEQFFSLHRGKETLGFLEEINDRFSILYSLDKADRSDKFAQSLVKYSTILDSLWISGRMFDAFLKKIREEHNPHRYIKMKFEYDAFFEGHNFMKKPKENNNDDKNGEDGEIYDDHRVSAISLVEEAGDIIDKLDGVRKLLPAFYSMGLLRFPSRAGKGGHDFYQNGKVTNRSDSFVDHRYQIKETVNSYQKITEYIEKLTWVNFEQFKSPDIGYSFNYQGSPVTIKFSRQLKTKLFRNFVDYTFEKGKHPFRILGKPIWVSEDRVHVYGVDLHLWQKVMLDLSRDQFTVFITKGTCGNTVHRFVTNIQRYLDPGLTVLIGNQKYEDIIDSFIEGSVNNDEDI